MLFSTAESAVAELAVAEALAGTPAPPIPPIPPIPPPVPRARKLRMSRVLQSGDITPGHIVQWTTDGVIQDGGPIAAAQKVLASAREVDFMSTADQPIIIPSSVTAWQLTGILVTNASGPLLNAQGGVYTAAGKTGASIVASTQTYATLTGPDLLLYLTLTAYAQSARFSLNNLPANRLYFSLTTGQPAAASADLYVVGIDLS